MAELPAYSLEELLARLREGVAGPRDQARAAELLVKHRARDWHRESRAFLRDLHIYITVWGLMHGPGFAKRMSERKAIAHLVEHPELLGANVDLLTAYQREHHGGVRKPLTAEAIRSACKKMAKVFSDDPELAPSSTSIDGGETWVANSPPDTPKLS